MGDHQGASDVGHHPQRDRLLEAVAFREQRAQAPAGHEFEHDVVMPSSSFTSRRLVT